MNKIEQQRMLAALEAQNYRVYLARQSAIDHYVRALEQDSAQMQATLRKVAALRVTLFAAVIIAVMIKITGWSVL